MLGWASNADWRMHKGFESFRKNYRNLYHIWWLRFIFSSILLWLHNDTSVQKMEAQAKMKTRGKQIQYSSLDFSCLLEMVRGRSSSFPLCFQFLHSHLAASFTQWAPLTSCLLLHSNIKEENIMKCNLLVSPKEQHSLRFLFRAPFRLISTWPLCKLHLYVMIHQHLHNVGLFFSPGISFTIKVFSSSSYGYFNFIFKFIFLIPLKIKDNSTKQQKLANKYIKE